MATIRAIYEDGQIRLLGKVDLEEGQELDIEITSQTQANTQKNYHVVRRENGWTVLGEGNSHPDIISDTQEDAIERAKLMAKIQNLSVIVVYENYKAEEQTNEYNKQRKFGLHQGLMTMSDDFDDPLPDSFWLGEEE